MTALALVGGANFTLAQTDVTSEYVTNAGFENCTAETSDVVAKTIKDYSTSGWTNANMGEYTTIAVTSYGSKVKVGGSTTPSTKKDGATVSGNTLGIIAGWSDAVTIQSGDITLPAGAYTLTVDHYLTSSTQNYVNTSSRFGFVTSGNSYLVSSTSFTASTWTTETVTFTLTEPTEGKIQIGLKGENKSGSGSPAVFYDDVTLTWTDPESAAHAATLAANKETLNGYIKKATALNGVLSDAALTTAIGTAQDVYDNATDYATDNDGVVSASTTLNNAITTALSSATAVALENGTFDTTPNNTLNGDGTTTFGGTLSTATSNPDNTKDMTANTGDHGYLYDVTGWTQYSKFNSTASQGTTSEYGTAMPANGWSTNSTTPPATDMFGGSTGAALHLSAGWGDQARYQQTINNLPSGRYVFYYEVINQHSNTGIASNYTGVNGAAGDFYGTTNSFVFSTLSSAAQGEWIAQAFEFDVAKTANINFNVGVTTSTAGSANGAKLWIDNVLVYRIGDLTVTDADAAAILEEVAALDDVVYNATDKNTLAEAKNTFENNKNIDNYNALNDALIAAKNSVTVYTTLNTAITNVEGWTATTAAEGIRTKYNNGEYANETTAANIYSEYQAAEMTALVADEATEFTSVILNHSFETGDMTGWSAEGRSDTGVKENSNATYTINNGVDGNYIFNSWGGSAENNVYQTIANLPAGTYQLSALLAGFTGEELVLAANETTNSVTVAGDKTTGNIVNVVFTLAEAGDVTIKASNTKATSADASFIKADNFTLKAYSDPLAALKEQLSTLQEQATSALANNDYANVTGKEKATLTTLSTLAPEETEEAYNTAISNITAAISAFTAAKTNYDIFATYNKELKYADADKKPSITDESTAASIISDLRAYYESHALAEGVEGAVSFADAIAGTDPEVNEGWTGGIGVDNRDVEKYTDAAGNPSGKYYDGGWSNTTGVNINMYRTIELPAGKYLLTVTARASEALTTYTLSVGDEVVNLPQNGSGVNVGVFGHGWDDVSLEFETDGTPVTLTIKAASTEYYQWVSFNRFRLMQLVDNGPTTGIESVATAAQKADETVYDLQGRRVNAMTKGLYIVNGKKVIK